MTAIAPDQSILWQPHAGPQSLFLESDAYEALYGGAAGGGKMLALDTPLPTPIGWTTMGDVKPGDLLFDESGLPCTVTAISEISPIPKSYRLTWDDGTSIEACSEHLWRTFDATELSALSKRTAEWRANRRASRKSKISGNKSELFTATITARNTARVHTYLPQPIGTIRSTQAIADTLLTNTGRRNHAIQLATSLLLPEQPLPIDPYVLGVWLGDGTSASGGLTGIDPEIWEEIEQAGYIISHSKVDLTHHSILGLSPQLRKIGLLGNKHVPRIYLRGSTYQRLALLQGLMDTDGHAALDGGCEFDNTRRCLVDAVYELVTSLGIKATIQQGTAKLHGRIIGPKWRVKFTTSQPVFRLPRKLARLRSKTRQTGKFRYIVSCEQVEPVPMRCIAVDSPSHLYLAGKGMIPTHNSDALLFGGLRQIDHPHYKALILRRTYPELRELMDRSLETFREIGGEWNEQGKRWKFSSGATYEFGYCDTYNDVLRYQGQQYTYIAYDEIGQLREERVWTYLMSRNRASSTGLTRWMRASANPGGPGHQWLKRRFINCCSPDGTPHEVRLDDGSYTTRAFVRARLADNPTLLEHDPSYASRLRLLPDLEYRWLADGDWDAGAGLGLAELSRDRHLVRPLVSIPSHWTLFGAFDWGYAHPFCFGLFAADEGGTVYLIESVHGRHLQPPEIVQRIIDTLDGIGIPLDRLRYTAAGHDCWADVKARSEHIPTIFEHCARLGLMLVKANISRIAGVQNMRRYLTWKQPDGKEIEPRFKICDTPSNRRVFECLEGIVSDPDNPEDTLKVDADEQGQGGDDPYDMLRYGLASRPVTAKQAALILTPKDRSPKFDYATKTHHRKTAQEEFDQLFSEQNKKPTMGFRIPRR